MASPHIQTNQGFDLVVPFNWSHFERNGMHTNHSRFLCTDSGKFQQEYYGSYARYFSEEQFNAMQTRLNKTATPEQAQFTKERIQSWHCCRALHVCSCFSFCGIPIALLTCPCVVSPWSNYKEAHAKLVDRMRNQVSQENELLQERLHGAADIQLFVREHHLYDSICWKKCLGPADLIHTIRIRCGSTIDAAAVPVAHGVPPPMPQVYPQEQYGAMGDNYHQFQPNTPATAAPVTGQVVGGSGSSAEPGSPHPQYSYYPHPQQHLHHLPNFAPPAATATPSGGDQTAPLLEKTTTFCSECGATLKPTDKFCPQCGTRND